MIFHVNRLQAGDPHDISCLICYFQNAANYSGGARLWVKLQLHIHDFGLGRATTQPDLSSRDASA